HAERLAQLERWGFAAPALDETVDGIEGCLDYHGRLEARRDEIPFEMDGVVAKLDDLDLRERMGSNSRATKWQYAHKFAPIEKTSVLRAIEIQVGVNGRLTPRAHVDPVEVLGVVVRHATLHNEDYVLTLGAAPGDRVFVKRAGDVIPQITAVSKKGEDEPEGWADQVPASLLADGAPRPGAIVAHGEPFAMPDRCPACGTEVVREGKYVRCPNVYGCGPQVVGRTVHMAGRGGFDIDSLGEKMIVQLFEAGHLESPADHFRLIDVPDEDLVAIERWGQKTVDNLKRELEEAKATTLDRFLAALSIPEVGGATARLLAKHFHSLEAVRDASLEELVTVDKIGEEVAGRIRTWFDGPENLALVDALLTSGVEPATEVEGGGRSGDAFEGEVCVFTGTLESMSRFEAKAAVEAQGGKVASSVSGKTTVLVQGGKPGSKAKKAEEKGVKVLLEEEFLQRLGVTRD
ncbi:MAG: helix-hairpin-helix domain-containing protein, partial [Planctomycetota bacterium]